MEQTTQTAVDSVESGKNYNAHNREDKFYFGGYFNLAQNNITTALEELKKRLNLVVEANVETGHPTLSEYLKHIREKLQSPLDRAKFLRLLTEYFPVVNFLGFDPERPKDMISEEEGLNKKLNNFAYLLKAIDELRNLYSHYPDQTVEIQYQTIRVLDHTLFKTVLAVKKKKLKTDKTKEALSDKLNKEWFDLAEEIKKTAKKKYKDENETAPLAVLNRAFSHFLFKENISAKKKADAKTNDFTKDNEQLHALSDAGVVLILSFFLTRKEYEAFRGNIKGFKGTSLAPNETPTLKKNSFQYMATQWVYTFNNFKGLKRPVRTTFEKETLLMQVLDYLSKIPDEVYKHLQVDQQKAYITDMNEYLTSFDETDLHDNQNEVIDSATILRPVVRKRYDDFFNYFALRFLDEFAGFHSLRFKIQVGTFVHDVRSKKLGSTQQETNRVLKETICVFDKLLNVNKKKERLEESDTLNAKGWNQFPNPSYAIVNNTIQIAFTGRKISTDEDKMVVRRASGKPSIDAIIHELYKDEPVHTEAHAVLSLNDLPALLFELLQTPESMTKKAKEIENKLSNIARDMHKHSDLSKTRKGKTLGKGFLAEKLKSDIRKEKNKTLLKRELIKQHTSLVKEEERKHVFYSREKGIEALWIANDILRLIPRDKRVDWKGYKHSELQRLIAVYPHRVDQQVKDLFRGTWEIDQDEFAGKKLMLCLQKPTFNEFYQAYLLLRKDVLNEIGAFVPLYNPEKEEHNKKMHLFWRFFDQRLYFNHYTNEEELKKASKGFPLLLPRGVFDDRPTHVAGKNPDDPNDTQEFAAWYIYARNKEHRYQAFYQEDITWEKAYQSMVEKRGEIRCASKFFLQEQSAPPTFKRFKLQGMDAIRKQQQKDLFLWQIATFLARELGFDEIDRFTLADTYISQEERKLRLQHAEAQSKREKGTVKPNLRAEHTFWEQSFEKFICDGKVKVGACKLKNSGKYHFYESDERLKQLFRYDTREVWLLDEIERELKIGPDAYENIRAKELLSHIQEFERTVIYPNGLAKATNVPDFRVDLALIYKNHLTDEEYNLLLMPTNKKEGKKASERLQTVSDLLKKLGLLIEIRNAFSHNQFPHESWFELGQLFLAKEPAETFARYYCRLIQHLCVEVTREVG